MLPRVILHVAVSVDGRTSGFAADLGTYYALAGRFGEDLTLAGSETILAADFPEESGGSAPVQAPSPDTRPLLAVVDSRGRVASWKALRSSGYWRDVIALCSEATPARYLDGLARAGAEYLRCSAARVDLRAALEALQGQYGIRTVRVESGGVLNGVLLREGLVHELSLLVHPVVAGGPAGPEVTGTAHTGPGQLELESAESLDGGLVWLRYRRTFRTLWVTLRPFFGQNVADLDFKLRSVA